MPKYMMLYKGDAADPADMPEDQVQEVMGKWAAWMEGVGAAITDMGTPFGAGTSLVDNGTTGLTVDLTGYTVVEADDLDSAKALADGHPFLSDGEGDFAIDIFELMPTPGM